MKRSGVIGKILIASVGIATTVAPAAHAQLTVQKELDQIDRTFVCPEDLPSNEARNTAIKLFLEQLAAIQPSITPKEIVEYRVSLLKRHHCNKTLAHLSQPAAPLPQAPNSPSHWEHAGRVVSNGNGINITVDMDSMVSAGPGRMRTWIKYDNDKPVGGVKESLVYEQLDCARSYHSTISLIRYAADGHIVSSDKGRASDEEPIIPDSLLAGILPFTCAAHGLSAR